MTVTRKHSPISACLVCGMSDERALVRISLTGGFQATLCGSHALILERAGPGDRSEHDLSAILRDRRLGADRRREGDELGEALAGAFRGERRGLARRGA